MKTARRSGGRQPSNRGAAPEPAGSFGIANVPGITASAKLLELGRGLYGLSVGGIAGDGSVLAGRAVPATHIAAWPAEAAGRAEILAAAAGPSGWLGPEGGTLAVRISAERAHLLITTYRLEAQPAVPLEIQLTRIDRPATAAAGQRQDAAPPAQIPTEIVLHIEQIGDRRFGGGEWIGSRGQKRRIEAFSIRPLERLTAAEVEYKAFGPGGRETPWVSAGKLCGTRGRGIPLTGFAVRLAAPASGRFDVVYEGAFFESGEAGPRRNGEACVPSKADDPLEAVNIKLVQKGTA